jgi:tRNA(Arg) A34 adenosine deaminase TadA
MPFLQTYELGLELPAYYLLRLLRLILCTSFEPCPLCLTRIINAGVRKTLYGVADHPSGMWSRFGDMPPFWKDMAKERDTSLLSDN